MLAIFLLCIFLTGGVYTPYPPCMSTPLSLFSKLQSARQTKGAYRAKEMHWTGVLDWTELAVRSLGTVHAMQLNW